MKKINIFFISCGLLFTSCNKFLDNEPLAQLTPEEYLTTEANIASYVTDRYALLPTHGTYGYGTFETDNNTDNMAGMQPSAIYAPGYWRVGQDGGSWYFDDIYKCNYFLEKVIPSLEKGQIRGSATNVKHYIGEMYFFRAFSYFERLKALGDFPIVTTTYPDESIALTEASKRAPRNEVARFILSDLDKAIEMMQASAPQGGKNRIYRDIAILLKSRVALYEGTWLKYFKGTAFVPNGPNWPGKNKGYNDNYEYPLGSVENEIDFFLKQAIEASKTIAEKYPLTINTGSFPETSSEMENPYFSMFADIDMEKYGEVMLWRRYNTGFGITNDVPHYACVGNAGIGTTKSMVDAFLLRNGEPIYVSPPWGDENESYWSDNNILNITKNRDSRADIFIKKPGQRNLHTGPGSHGVEIEQRPDITSASIEFKYTTGYALRKGLNPNGRYTDMTQSIVGSIVFRAAEGYLNYIEAVYELNGALDNTADKYWRAIRKRAGVNEDYRKTINLTDMSKEAETDWGAYSGGMIVDATRYNIRRERRCEFMAEGLRMMDLKRWRAMDQMISTPYHVLGFNLWTEMYNWDWYKDASGQSILKEGQNVSARTFSTYLAPYHIVQNNIAYDGYRWNMAHYLDPIATEHFLVTSSGDITSSPIYQNPGWPTTAGGVAE